MSGARAWKVGPSPFTASLTPARPTSIESNVPSIVITRVVESTAVGAAATATASAKSASAVARAIGDVGAG